ncbi:MAG: hypothetical protein IKZ91_03480, partial [Bacteroidales bacterium]|nr:hypothetical protein [Bacteroidales bacterium]
GPSHSRGHGRPRFPETLPVPITQPADSGTGKPLSFSRLASDLWENLPEVNEQEVDSQTDADSVRIVRPILEYTREEIRSWMTERGYQWREDSTNAEDGVKRNKIRNRVFPVFAQINPSFIKTLVADMERFRQTDDIADEYYHIAAERIIKYAPEASAEAILQISVTGLLELRHWRYVLWRALEDYGFSAETFDKLCTLLERYRTEASGTVTLSGKTFQSTGYVLLSRRKSLLLYSTP